MDRQIRETLECPCCFELMVQPMMFASCGHSFCNLCIRRFLQQQQMNNVKKHCPVCNSVQTDGERNLVSCLALSHVIDILRPGSTPPSSASTATKSLDQISKLPTLVYHLMSDDKLDEALRGCSLPCGSGISRERKIMLHREYTLQVNSLCDAGTMEVDLQELCKLVKSACAPKAAATPRNPFASTAAVKKSPPPVKFKREHKQLRADQRKRWKASYVADTWRAVFSDELNQPVYYNTETKECTTQRPTEMEQEQQQDDDSVVVVVIKDE